MSRLNPKNFRPVVRYCRRGPRRPIRSGGNHSRPATDFFTKPSWEQPGADIASEQGALQAGWQGDTGMSYQAWRAQWNQAMEQLVLSYRAMAGTHENNTTSMLARDAAEGAKWGG